MRIIAGTYRGRTIQALPGRATRPTTDRTREAWASSVGSLLPSGFEGIAVLDAFAGSGALGIEALSRGAARAVFCESNSRAADVLRQNLSMIDGKLHTASVIPWGIFSPRALRTLGRSGTFQLVILDPPYDLAAARIGCLLQTLIRSSLLSDGALISYEHQMPVDNDPGASVLVSAGSLDGCKMVSCKTYGTTRIEYLIYRKDHAIKEH